MRNTYGALLPPVAEAESEMVRLASAMGVSFARRDVQAELDKEAFPSMAGMGQALSKGFGTAKGVFGVLNTPGAVTHLGGKALGTLGTGIKNTAGAVGGSITGAAKSVGGAIGGATTRASNAMGRAWDAGANKIQAVGNNIKTQGLANQYASNRAQGNVMSAAGLTGPGISQEQRRAAAQVRLQGMQGKGIQMGSKSESIGKLNPATGGTIQAPGGARPTPAPSAGADPYRTAAPKPPPSSTPSPPPPPPAGQVTPPSAGQPAAPPPAPAGQVAATTAAPAPAGQVTPPPATPPTVTPTPSSQPAKPGLLEQSGLTSNAGTKLMGLGLGLGTLYAGTQVAKHVAGALGGHPHEYQYGNPNGQPQATPNQYGQVS